MSTVEQTVEPGIVSRAASAIRGIQFAPLMTPLFITAILLTGHFSFGILEAWEKTLLAIATCIAAEVALSRWLYGKWPHPASAYISGISVGILVRSPFFWPFAITGLLSIMSKYVLRYNGRHLWNPSNFGICALLVLAPEVVAHLSIQWGNNLWPMLVIWALGSMIIYRLKRFHICATYVVSFLLLAWARTAFTGDSFWAEVAPLTGPMYQLFVFFMITDPKTTVKSKFWQCAVVAVVALVEAGMRLGEVVHAPFYALFLVGPVALFVETHLQARRQQAELVAAA